MNKFIPKLIWILILNGIFSGLVYADGISLRNIKNNGEDGTVPQTYFDCGGYKETVLIKDDEPVALFIPIDEIEKAKIIHVVCETKFYQPFDMEISVSKQYALQLKQFYANNVGKEYAEYINNELISVVSVIEPAASFDIRLGCFTLEQVVQLSINLGFQPKYETICVNKKAKLKDLSSSYKFKAKRDYVPLKNSPLWILTEEKELLNNLNDKKRILIIPSQKAVEQYYDEREKNFVRKDGFIKVMYQDKTGWIDSKSAIPFLSTLDNNVFLEKFFENHEQFYHSELIAPQAINKRKTIRNLYVSEAKSRFASEKEFTRWYRNTFGKEFYEKD
jgi:hypothetical protein